MSLPIPKAYKSLIFSQEEKEYCWIVETINGIWNLPKISHNQFKNSRTALYKYLKEKHSVLHTNV